MSDITVSCPQTRRTYTHKADMGRMQKSPGFKQMKKDHALIPGAICAHCRRAHGQVRINWRTQEEQLDKNGHVQLTHLTINHKYTYLSLSPSLYLTWDPVTMEVCCTICNGHYRKGMEVCPVCGTTPIQKDEPGGKGMCNACYLALHPEIQKEREERKEIWDEGARLYKKGVAEKHRDEKSARPCVSWKIGGTCAISGNPCTFTKSRMLKLCPDAVAKKKFIPKLHSCHYRGLGQKCKRTPGAICEHNTRNAPNKCLKFKARMRNDNQTSTERVS